jgi:hypothetical protein
MDSGNFRTWVIGSGLLCAALVGAGFGLQDDTGRGGVPSGLDWVRVGGLAYAAIVAIAWRPLLAVLSPSAADSEAEERTMAGSPYATLFIVSFVALFSSRSC